jgi:hypothetical protein
VETKNSLIFVLSITLIMKKNKTDLHKLTPEIALSLLEPHKERMKLRVHSFTGGGFALMGCDIDLTQIKKYLKETSDIRLAGPNMLGMGHGVAYYDEKQGYVFLETNKEKLAKIFNERGI